MRSIGFDRNHRPATVYSGQSPEGHVSYTDYHAPHVADVVSLSRDDGSSEYLTIRQGRIQEWGTSKPGQPTRLLLKSGQMSKPEAARRFQLLQQHALESGQGLTRL